MASYSLLWMRLVFNTSFERHTVSLIHSTKRWIDSQDEQAGELLDEQKREQTNIIQTRRRTIILLSKQLEHILNENYFHDNTGNHHLGRQKTATS